MMEKQAVRRSALFIGETGKVGFACDEALLLIEPEGVRELAGELVRAVGRKQAWRVLNGFCLPLYRLPPIARPETLATVQGIVAAYACEAALQQVRENYLRRRAWRHG